jgi:hypothetical protein
VPVLTTRDLGALAVLISSDGVLQVRTPFAPAAEPDDGRESDVLD